MRRGFLVAIVSLAMLGATAQAETYICKVKPDGRDTGWISKSIAINIDSKTDQVLVSDAVILGFNKKPLQGQLSVANGKRSTVTWEVRSAKDAKNQNVARFIYRATILHPSNKIIISARPSGYHNSFSGHGRCDIRQ